MLLDRSGQGLIIKMKRKTYMEGEYILVTVAVIPSLTSGIIRSITFNNTRSPRLGTWYLGQNASGSKIFGIYSRMI